MRIRSFGMLVTRSSGREPADSKSMVSVTSLCQSRTRWRDVFSALHCRRVAPVLEPLIKRLTILWKRFGSRDSVKWRSQSTYDNGGTISNQFPKTSCLNMRSLTSELQELNMPHYMVKANLIETGDSGHTSSC